MPLLVTTTTTYDYRYGLPKDVTDVNGGVTSFGYDAFGRKTSVWSALDQGTDPTQRLTYALNSAAPSVIRIETRNDAGGANSVYTNDWTLVDGLGRVVQTQKPSEASNQMIVTSRAFNSRGLLEMVSVPLRVTGIVPGTYQTPDWAPLAETKYAYDALDRQTRLTTPDNLVTYTAYDHWTTTITNTNGIPTKYRTDAFGRTNRVTESESGVSYHTAYGYDVLDRLTQVTDSAGNVTTMSYDWLGRKTAMSDPDMGAWSYRYDKNDNLIEQTDAKLQRACFYYDGLNRLRGKNYQTNATSCPATAATYAVTYNYDQGTNALGQTQKGFRTQVIDANNVGQTTYQFDLLGRLLKETKTITGAPANPYVTEYSYNQLNQPLTMKYPNDGQGIEMVTTNYNAQRLPESMTTYVSSAAYDASDQMGQVTFGNTVATTYTYNPLTQRLETLKAGPTNNLQNYSYTYDNVGNVKTINDLLRGQVATYNYDDLNRLESANIPNVYSHSWTYNLISNMLTRNDNNGNVTYQYNDANHKHAVSQIGSQYFCYDANGNMTKRASANSACSSGGDTLAYDQENKLTSITVGGTTTTYAYDADGARVKKVAGGTTTYYVGNHYEVTNNVATKYYYFGSKRVAMKVGSTVTYLHGDHLGSASVTTNSSGACTSAQWYYAYGNVRTPAPTTPCSGTLPTDYTFTGQKRDASANLMYYNARYYDTTLGRFISADTLVPSPNNPQDLNRYGYTRNNPLRYTDPSGHCPICLFALGVYGAVRVGYEVATTKIPDWDQARRDQIGGHLVTNMSEIIEKESASRNINPTIVKAILRHESGAFERRVLTPLPNNNPGAISDMAEAAQVLVQGGTASIGPGQMQVRRGEELETAGYVRPRPNGLLRINDMIRQDSSVEYVAGMVEYLSDRVDARYPQLSTQNRERLVLLGYNLGWDGPGGLEALLDKFGYRQLISRLGYDEQTYDEFLRWWRAEGWKDHE